MSETTAASPEPISAPEETVATQPAVGKPEPDSASAKPAFRPLVLYHAGCADGFCAAWCAHRKIGDQAEYIPVQYSQAPPDVADREVYVLDFCYPRAVMQELIAKARVLVLLDHHQTAQRDLDGLLPDVMNGAETMRQGGDLIGGSGRVLIRFNLDKSGGRLAWEYFFPGEPSPWLVDYTEDRDLWRFTLPDSRAINAALAVCSRDFETWNDLAKQERGWKSWQMLIEQGEAVLRYQKQLVEAHVKNAVEIDLDGYRILAVNATCLMSEIGERLAEGRPFGATYFQRSDGRTVWSLRSSKDGIDVSEIARRHGGGGHKHAAGFTQQRSM